MKKFRVEMMLDIYSYYREVEAKSGFEAVLQTVKDLESRNDKRAYWPMRVIEL